MTADAKVGLLLGLIFIVVIAFLINGLPKFLQAAPEEVVTTQIDIPTAPDMIIDNPVVETARQMDNDIPLRRTTPPQQVVVLDDPSSQIDSVERRLAEQIPSASVPVPDIVSDPEPVQQTTYQQSAQTPRYHVVQPGEMLPTIARKYYGQEDGNRRIIIEKLYEANKNVIDSPDKIRVNDKLVIPPLDELLNGPKQTVTQVASANKKSSLLSRFSNLFEPTASDKGDKYYVVQEGESLWSIAQKTLGDGKRYKDIMAINRNIKDPDDVKAGMNLKIPQK